MSSMMHQMRVRGYEEAEIAGILQFRCRVPAVDREEQLMGFENDIHGWIHGHLGETDGIAIASRDAIRHGDEFELVVKVKVTP